jgi:hypothetical protein
MEVAKVQVPEFCFLLDNSCCIYFVLKLHLIRYNICRYNLQFLVLRIKKLLNKIINLTKSYPCWHKDNNNLQYSDKDNKIIRWDIKINNKI